MEKITSFEINHLKLLPGLYVSRKDYLDDKYVLTTFDLRITRPNFEQVIETGAVHTYEHLGATYLRNSEVKDKIIYFGPMGCRTGFYLIMVGDYESSDILELIINMNVFIMDYTEAIPGASSIECGNYLDQDLAGAKFLAKKYLNETLYDITPERLIYPNI